MKKNKKTGWYNVNLEQYARIANSKDLLAIAEVVGGDIPISQLKAVDFSFLSTPVPQIVPPRKLVLNGRKYYTMLDIRELSVAAYMDYERLVKNNADLWYVLSPFIIPDGYKASDYGEYDMDQVYNDLKTMSIVDGFAICNFFLLQWETCLKAIQSYFQSHQEDKGSKEVLQTMEYYYTLKDLLNGLE